MAISPDGRIWIDSGGGYCGGKLWRCEGAACEEVQFGDYPEGFRIQVNTIAAAPDGDVWVSALRWLQDDEGNISGLTDLIARFDGEGWTPYDSPSAGPGGVWDLAVGRDGLVWFAGDHLTSFDGTTWTRHIEEGVSEVDVAPDGTVWYSDEQGVHILTP
jgi:streptogramin lyase